MPLWRPLQEASYGGVLRWPFRENFRGGHSRNSLNLKFVEAFSGAFRGALYGGVLRKTLRRSSNEAIQEGSST